MTFDEAFQSRATVGGGVEITDEDNVRGSIFL